MTISISSQAYNELCQETVEPSQHPDPDDELDVVLKFPHLLGSGYWREIELREGLEVIIGNFQLQNHMTVGHPEAEDDWIKYHFHFSGEHQDKYALKARQFAFSGTGLIPRATMDCLDTQPYLEVMINIKPETLHSFMSNPAEELPPELQPLIRQSDQERYYRTGTATPTMQTVTRRILQCPYQGIAKRLYLEGQALELLGLLMTQEVEIRSGTFLLTPSSLM